MARVVLYLGVPATLTGPAEQSDMQNRQQKPLYECAVQTVDPLLLLTTTRNLPPSPSNQKPNKGPSPVTQNHKIF